MSEHTIKQFDVDLEQIRSGVLAMGGLVEKQLARAMAAIELRMIMTVTKVVNDLERIGDEVKKIAYKAEQTRDIGKLAQVRFYDVARALASVRAMLQAALDAFARLDAAAAAEVVGNDEEVDAAFQAILRQLISYMMEDPRTISSALEIVFIAKSIERIGDHAKNVAESVVQIVKGVDVRHASAEQIRAEIGQR